MTNKTKIIKAWAILDIDGKIKHPSVSIFDIKKDAKKEVDRLNKLPIPTDKRYIFGGKNIIVSCEIKYQYDQPKQNPTI